VGGWVGGCALRGGARRGGGTVGGGGRDGLTCTLSSPLSSLFAACPAHANPTVRILQPHTPQSLKRWRLMLKALPAECRGSFRAAVEEAARRIWGARARTAAAAAAGGEAGSEGGAASDTLGEEWAAAVAAAAAEEGDGESDLE